MARTDMGDDRLSRGFEISRDQIFLGWARHQGHDVENTNDINGINMSLNL